MASKHSLSRRPFLGGEPVMAMLATVVLPLRLCALAPWRSVPDPNANAKARGCKGANPLTLLLFSLCVLFVLFQAERCINLLILSPAPLPLN